MNIKREIEAVGAAYVECFKARDACFKARDAAGIAALYAEGGGRF